MIRLNAAKVIAAARVAYDAGKLAAQNGGECYYRSDAGPCAIGAGMTDKQAAKLTPKQNDRILWSLINSGVVTVSPKKAADDLADLQAIHDRWAQARVSTERAAIRARFAEKLADLERVYATA